jgi:hypothetical protein
METHEPSEAVWAIQSRDDFVAFVALLREALHEQPDWWENPTLDSYLETLGSWTNGMNGFYRNILNTPAPEQPDWQMLGHILLAAAMYE